jgi:CO/xanthine dehydrogenase Mo-binding subunit
MFLMTASWSIKGMVEGGLLPVAPAIGNSVYNAVGVRVYDLPITPERLWRAMREKADQS